MNIVTSWQKIRTGMLLLAMSVGLSVTTTTTANAETTLERAKQSGTIRIGFSNDPPFSFSTLEGKFTGSELEIARVALAQMGIDNIEYKLGEFSALIPGLYADRIDINGAGPYITPKRCAEVIFSEPTYRLGQAFLVRAGNPKNLHSYEDVAKNPDAIIAINAGAAEQDYARRAGIPEGQVMTVPDTTAQFAAVKSGRADAAAQSGLAIQDMAQKGGLDVERASPFVTPPYAESYGSFAFRKDDTDLRDAFNAFLKDFIGTKEHLDLVKEFGFTENELPGDKTSADLCTG